MNRRGKKREEKTGRLKLRTVILNESFRAVLTDVECEFPYRVSLMEALKPVEADCDYIETIIEKTEMGDDQLLARLPLALQMSGSESRIKAANLHDVILYRAMMMIYTSTLCAK